jgi:hypothetical protein
MMPWLGRKGGGEKGAWPWPYGWGQRGVMGSQVHDIEDLGVVGRGRRRPLMSRVGKRKGKKEKIKNYNMTGRSHIL